MTRGARSLAKRPARQLMLDDGHGAAERAAEHVALEAAGAKAGRLSGAMAGLRTVSEQEAGRPAPGSVRATLGEPGRPLDATSRVSAERLYGRDFSTVRVHTGRAASRSAAAVDAHAYTVGDRIVLGAAADRASSSARNHLLAHEMAHVVQDSPGVVRRYRRAGSMAFGERDTATLVEQTFDPRTDKDTKPWIELITAEFTGSRTDSDGFTYSTGTATVRYHANAAKLPDLTISISGGSPGQLGRSDPGSFTVDRIEGYGYNSGTASGTAGVDFQWSEREKGKNWRYAKKDPLTGERDANMSFAVFYHGGEALHAGSLDDSSHGCLHVDWNNEDVMKQINYHSVVGLTRVKVSYAKKP